MLHMNASPFLIRFEYGSTLMTALYSGFVASGIGIQRRVAADGVPMMVAALLQQQEPQQQKRPNLQACCLLVALLLTLWSCMCRHPAQGHTSQLRQGPVMNPSWSAALSMSSSPHSSSSSSKACPKSRAGCCACLIACSMPAG